jgi:hypothetical protein
LPVSDIDRALRFYVDRVGFALDVDYTPNDALRVVQLTPPGSACSIQFGTGLTNAARASVRNIYLVVTDLEAARSILLERGSRLARSGTRYPLMPGMDVSLSAPGTKPTCCRGSLMSVVGGRADLARICPEVSV